MKDWKGDVTRGIKLDSDTLLNTRIHADDQVVNLLSRWFRKFCLFKFTHYISAWPDC